MLQLLRFLVPGILFWAASLSFAQTTSYGGRGMLRVFSAETVQARSFFVNSFFSSYLNPSGNSHVWTVGLTYGLQDQLELAAQLIPYQDAPGESGVGDIQLSIKWRLPFTSTKVHAGLRGVLVLPTAKSHQLAFEPYSSNQVAWGMMALLTFDIPTVPLKISTNLGYLDHNIETIFSGESTDQLQIGVGFKFLIYPFIMYGEYSGEIFFNNDVVDFRDNAMRWTQGFRFKTPMNLIVDLGFDVGLSRELQVYPEPLREHADWRILAGLTYHFLPKKFYRLAADSPKVDIKQQEEMIREIREKRRKVDENLDEMRKKLKEKEKKP